GQIPWTVIGESENVALLPGTVIDALSVGGGCIFTASSPYPPGCGSGVGSGVSCAPTRALLNATRQAANIKPLNPHLVFWRVTRTVSSPKFDYLVPRDARFLIPLRCLPRMKRTIRQIW